MSNRLCGCGEEESYTSSLFPLVNVSTGLNTGSKMSSKLGRKGDPRMHKAVAARLSNPSLSLYEALCIGGFEYSENDDKSVLDEKQVTLGQRKNQLSRRLRLARKQQSNGESAAARASSSTINGVIFDNNAGQRNGTNVISNSQKGRIEQKSADGKPNDPLLGHTRSKIDLINELGTSSFNKNSNGRNGEAMGAQQQKRQRFTKCLNSTTFERTCTMTPNLNYIHQGWPVANLPHMGGDGTSNAILAPGAVYGQAQGVNYSHQFYNPQLTNRIPDQNIQRFQQGASAVALSSLAASAQSVGLSLDQLALTLSSNTTSLSKLVAEVRSGDSDVKQEQMALDLYQVDVKGLYTKCLLVAGVDSSLAGQNSPNYIKFAIKAWEAEGKRLRSLQDKLSGAKEIKTVVATSPPGHIQGTPNSRQSKRENDNNETTVVSADSDGYIQSQDNDSRNNTHSNFQNSANGENTMEKQDRQKCDSRHIHRLNDCGHKAVIHNPKDGASHIDFIVNDQIECYAGHDSVSLADPTWLSKMRCKDVDDFCTSKNCGKSDGSDLETTWGQMDSLVQEPKIFKLSEIDTTDSEWAFESNENTEGLFRESSGEQANT